MNIVEARQKLTFWGWVVAVHNDYKLKGKHRTLWLFTCGTRCAKGEGSTDEEAIAEVLKEVEKQAAEAWAAGDRENDAARMEVARQIDDRKKNERIEKLLDVATQLRKAMPSLALPARTGEPNWELEKLQAIYPDPDDGNRGDRDYVTSTIDGDVIRAACEAADKVLT